MGSPEARKAPCLRRQGREDCHWAVEGGLGEEQERQDREQEEVGQGQEEPLDRRREQGARGVEDQGLLRHQEGLGIVQEGEGALQEVSGKATIPLKSGPSGSWSFMVDGYPEAQQ